MPDYARYAGNLVGTPLFQGMEAGEIRILLEAMAPPVRHGRKAEARDAARERVAGSLLGGLGRVFGN